MASDVTYWLQDKAIRNFGDFLSEFLQSQLFYGKGLSASTIRIIGSCIDDMFVDHSSGDTEDHEDQSTRQPKVVFWGCGLREESGLSEANRESVEILAV